MTSFKLTENLSLKKEIRSFLSHSQHRKLEHNGGESGKNQPISPQSSPFSPTESYTFKLKKLSQLFQASSKSQHNMNFIRRGPALIYSLFPQTALHLIFTLTSLYLQLLFYRLLVLENFSAFLNFLFIPSTPSFIIFCYNHTLHLTILKVICPKLLPCFNDVGCNC